MNKIKLANPVVVSLPENEAHRSAILDLLKYQKCICYSDGAPRLADIEDEKPGCLTGIEAARFYCWVYGIELEEVTEIDVEDIVSECDDLDMLADIIYLISRVDMKNKRLSVLTTLDAPEIIIRSEKRILQKRAEQLAFNCACDEPFTWRTDDGEVIAASLCCIGYEL